MMIKTRLYRFCSFADISNINSIKSRIGGSSKTPEYDLYRTYYNKTIDDEKLARIPGVTIVKSKEDVKRVLDILHKYSNRACAWDTETIDIDVRNETPVGRGKLICASAFAGPEVNFGNGPRLFIDNFAQNSDLILLFKDYFEDENYQKSWHHYGFDRHIFANHGIAVRGFHSDTMHLARLLDPSGLLQDYSLSNLSKKYQDELIQIKEQILQSLHLQNLSPQEFTALKHFENDLKADNLKVNMKEIFGERKKLKTGELSKVRVFPKILQMHCLPQYIEKWVQYSTLDAEVTYFLTLVLKQHLKKRFVRDDQQPNEFSITTLADIYKFYWSPLGELLTEMEKKGMQVDIEHVQKIKLQAEEDMKEHERKFKEWVQSTQETDVSQFNCNSTQQLQQLLFAPCERNLKHSQQNKAEATSNEEEEEEYLSDGRKKSVRKEIDSLPEVKAFLVPNLKGIKEADRQVVLKNIHMHIKGLGVTPLNYTPSGLPSADFPVLKALVGNVHSKKYGAIYDFFAKKGQPEKGEEACVAINELVELRSIEVLLNTFIIPLLELTDKDGRIHSSININTETGRLSSRNPNLLNQPALEKDRYKIRKSFVAPKGKKLIVADYGQLELRVLAHMTNCKTMIDAFNKGGDFHSRTVLTMYPNILEEVEKGVTLLEWDKSKGAAPVPLVKDKYASERRKAKVLNFSIAYGKTALGFASDWNCTIQEAQQTIDLWFAQRREVVRGRRKLETMASGKTKDCEIIQIFADLARTIQIFGQATIRNGNLSGHGLRASINTPIQGGAADIVIAAMIRIYKNQRLKELGFTLLLQVHDELILEGPEEHSQEALQLVKHLMENPFDIQLHLPLEVDAKIGNNWYECK